MSQNAPIESHPNSSLSPLTLCPDNQEEITVTLKMEINTCISRSQLWYVRLEVS